MKGAYSLKGYVPNLSCIPEVSMFHKSQRSASPSPCRERPVGYDCKKRAAAEAIWKAKLGAKNAEGVGKGKFGHAVTYQEAAEQIDPVSLPTGTQDRFLQE